jgi:predicted RNase H-like HicB family nuclease
MNRYAIEIVYSDKAGGYVATVPELPGCSALGDTEEEALAEIKAAMTICLSYAAVEKRDIPEPMGEELLQRIYLEQEEIRANRRKKEADKEVK